jgi:hypothetical protein
MAPEPLFGRKLSDIMRMTPKELGAMRQAGLWLSVIQDTPLQPTIPLEIPPGTPPCQALIQIKVISEDGTVLDKSTSAPFQIMESGAKTSLIRIQMEPLTREGVAVSGEIINVKCRALGTFNGPTPLSAFWWVGTESTEGVRWSVERIGEERSFSLKVPELPAGGPPQEVQLLWNDIAGNIVGRESIEVRPMPVVDFDFGSDSLAEWPWVRASYRVSPRPSPQSDLVWYVGGAQAYVQYGDAGNPQFRDESGQAEILVPPGIAKTLLDGEEQDITVDLVERGLVMARAKKQIGALGSPHPRDQTEILTRYLNGLGKMNSGRGPSVAQTEKPDSDRMPFLVGVVGKLPIYHGASLRLRADEALEYIVRVRWRGDNEIPPNVVVLTKISSMDSITMMEGRLDIPLVSGRAEAGPFRWTVPANAPDEIRLSVSLSTNEKTVREKNYVLRLSDQ